MLKLWIYTLIFPTFIVNNLNILNLLLPDTTGFSFILLVVAEEADTVKRLDNNRQFIGKREDSENQDNLWSSHHLDHNDVKLQQLDVNHALLDQEFDEAAPSYKRASSWSYMKRMPQFIGKRGGKMRFIGKRDEMAQRYPLPQNLDEFGYRQQLLKQLRREMNNGVQSLQEKRNSRKFIGKRKSLFIG